MLICIIVALGIACQRSDELWMFVIAE